MNKEIDMLAGFLLKKNLAPKGNESACEGAVRVIKQLEEKVKLLQGDLKIKCLEYDKENGEYPESKYEGYALYQRLVDTDYSSLDQLDKWEDSIDKLTQPK